LEQLTKSTQQQLTAGNIGTVIFVCYLVYLTAGDWAWLQYVERKGTFKAWTYDPGWEYEYQEIKYNNPYVS
jgi:hypothetical protein